MRRRTFRHLSLLSAAALALTTLTAPAQALPQPQATNPSRIYFGTLDGRVKWIPMTTTATPTQVVIQPSGSLLGVTAIATDVTNSKLYWAGQDATNAGYVRRANLTEGADPTLLWQEPRQALLANYVTGLAIDTVESRIYWSGVQNGTGLTYLSNAITAPLVSNSLAEGDRVLTYDETTYSLLTSNNRAVSTVEQLHHSWLASTPITAGETKVSSIVRSLDHQTIYWASCLELISTAAQQDCAGVIRAKTGDAAPVDLVTGITGLTSLAIAENGCIIYGTAKGVVGSVANLPSCTAEIFYDGTEIITSLYVVSAPITTGPTEIQGGGYVGQGLICVAQWARDRAYAHLDSGTTLQTYAWYKDGTPITGETTPYLIPREPGSYNCDSGGFNLVGTSLAEQGAAKQVQLGTQIRGLVQDSLGRPIVHANINIINSMTAPTFSDHTTTGLDGTFSYAVPSAGTWYVLVGPDNAGQNTNYLPDLSGQTITVAEGQQSDIKTITLKSLIAYTGKIVDSSNMPIANASISAWNAPRTQLTPTLTDQAGEFSLLLDEGQPVRLQIIRNDDYEVKWLGGNSYDDATVYTPALGTSSNLGTLILNRIPVVTGKVLIASVGLPLAGTVTLFWQGTQFASYSGVVSADGSFTISAPAGTYKACFTSTVRKFGSMCANSRGIINDANSFVLAPGDVKTLNFTMPRALLVPSLKATKTSATKVTLQWNSVPSAAVYEVRAQYGASTSKLSAATRLTLNKGISFVDTSSAIKKKPKYACYTIRAVGNSTLGAYSARKCVKLA